MFKMTLDLSKRLWIIVRPIMTLLIKPPIPTLRCTIDVMEGKHHHLLESIEQTRLNGNDLHLSISSEPLIEDEKLTRRDREVIDFTRSHVKIKSELTNLGNYERIEGYNGK